MLSLLSRDAKLDQLTALQFWLTKFNKYWYSGEVKKIKNIVAIHQKCLNEIVCHLRSRKKRKKKIYIYRLLAYVY